MAAAFRLEGPIDVAAMQRVFRTLRARHDALRTVFVVIDGSLLQIVRSAIDGEVLTERDWTREAPRAADLHARVCALAAVPFDLAGGPLFDAELLRVGGGRVLLLVRLHHSVGDATSIRILMDEALVLYAAFHRGEDDPLPPLPILDRDLAAWQNSRVSERTREDDRRYWRQALDGAPARSGFTPDRVARPRTGADVSQPPPAAGVVSTACDLDEPLTGRLREVAARHHTTLFSVVLSAVYALLYRHTGQADVVVGTTISRRDHPLLERQVGCYIDTLPLRAPVTGRDSATTLVSRTAGVCREALAHRLDGVDSPPFDLLVDYLAAAPAAAGPVADSGLGLTDFELDREGAHYDSMFLIAESDRRATLSIRLVFNASLFTPGLVESLSARLLTVLHWLADDTVLTLGALDLFGAARPARRRVRVTLDTTAPPVS